MSQKRLILSLATVGLMLLPSGTFADPGDLANAAHTSPQSPPILLGTSGSTETLLFDELCFAGTLGGLVEDADGTPYILSNNHILAQLNTLSAGESIIHPALFDDEDVCSGVVVPTTVATLSSFVTIRFCKSAGPFFIKCKVNTVDAAIAAVVVGEVNLIGEILDIGVPATAPVSATLNMAVQKSGRTTGHTVGVVSGIDVDVFICYADPCDDPSNIALFVNQVSVNGDFSDLGDSGSVIVECENDGNDGCAVFPGLVGLLFAGGTNITFFNRFEDVQSALGVAPVGCGVACFDAEDGGSPSKGRGPGGNGPPGQNKSVGPGLERASEVRARHADELLQHRGVLGTGIAVDDLGNPVIVVYVKDATSEPNNPIPWELEGITVKVVVTGQIRAF